MERIVGTITSKKTDIVYYVKWDDEIKYSWFSKDKQVWSLACKEVYSAEDAVSCAQRYIDGQPYLY
jgi:hypothetical protein